MKLEGTTVAMITPFTTSDEVDEEGMRENINYLMDNGVEGLLAAGTTGESATITHQEQRKMMDILVDEVNGRVKAIAGAGDRSRRVLAEATLAALPESGSPAGPAGAVAGARPTRWGR